MIQHLRKQDSDANGKPNKIRTPEPIYRADRETATSALEDETYILREHPDGTLEVIWSPPLSEIELRDIRESEEQFARGEGTLYSSVEDMRRRLLGDKSDNED